MPRLKSEKQGDDPLRFCDLATQTCWREVLKYSEWYLDNATAESPGSLRDSTERQFCQMGIW